MLEDSAWPLLVLLPFAAHFTRCVVASPGSSGHPRPAEVALDSHGYGPRQLWLRRVGVRALQPVCDWLIAAGVGPNTLTAGSLLLCIAGGTLIALGAITLGGVLGLLGCSLDYFDGRVARASDRASPSGAFLDGTFDRLGEFVLLGGAAIRLHDSVPALAACLVALGAGALVSYSRAKAEALGLDLRAGLMQRPERALLFGLGACSSHALDALLPASARGQHALFAWTIALLALLTSHSAWLRVVRGFRELRRGEAAYTDARPMTGFEHPSSNPACGPGGE
jgi:CDP-diacylglycerol--glycerol-3-phosphate 3-phosphatidyltransferase